MAHEIKEEDLASVLLKYILLGLIFNLIFVLIIVAALEPDLWNHGIAQGLEARFLPSLMTRGYFLAAIVNSFLNMLFYVQLSESYRKFGGTAKLINYLFPGSFFLLIMLLRHGFDFGYHNQILYASGIINMLYGVLIYYNMRDVSVTSPK